MAQPKPDRRIHPGAISQTRRRVAHRAGDRSLAPRVAGVHPPYMADPTLSDVMAILVRMELRQRQHSNLLENLSLGEQIMSQEMDQLVTAVATNTTVDQSVLTFLQGVAQQITDAAGDRTKSLQLAATVKASTDAVTAALLANTPSAPTPPPSA